MLSLLQLDRLALVMPLMKRRATTPARLWFNPAPPLA